ncbi:hypothetical protein A3860_11655 [Niastella vici]|uniref:Uncharacterized protein n=1 Tax=Niastella vici TaxID=1703345 RepID=A0A1V9FFS4_9BACT|nr:hypothetical protein [Niastella vici]OQP57208.1 hypothetical protein A3860_11655 [Niastella vici]
MNPLSTILPALTGCILFISCNNIPSASTANTAQVQTVADTVAGPPIKTAAELRHELLESEAADPAGMLSITGNMQENKIQTQKPDFFHHSQYATDGYIIKGLIRSKASVATLKDAVVQITFLTETNTELATTDSRVYKYFPPNEATSFELKVYPPENTKNFEMRVVSAMAVK